MCTYADNDLDCVLGGKSYNFKKVEIYNESKLHFYRVDRQQMGVYMCIATNDVPPTVSKRVALEVNCELIFISNYFYSPILFFIFTGFVITF